MGEKIFWNEWYLGFVMDLCVYLNKIVYIKKFFFI